MITLEKMYEAQANSPETKILGELSASATRVQVEDASVLPGKIPFLLTLGFDKAASETVRVTAVSGNTLEIERGMDGNAMIWMPGTKCARVMTAKDLNDLQANVTKLNERKQDQVAEVGLLKCTEPGKVEKAVPGKDYAEKAVEAIAYLVKEKKWKITFTDGTTELISGPIIPTMLSELTGDATHRTVSDAEKETWSGKSDFSGDYNDLQNPPSIPTKLSELTGDATHRTVSDAEKQTWGGKSDFSGKYDDLGGKPETFPPSAHNQSASTIQAGTFAGQVASPSSGQSPVAYCLRNSKMSNSGERPTVNGQVVIGYDGKPSSVMVGGTVYPIGGGGGSAVTKLYNSYVYPNTEAYIGRNLSDYTMVFVIWRGMKSGKAYIDSVSICNTEDLTAELHFGAGTETSITIDFQSNTLLITRTTAENNLFYIFGIK